jgi:Flp pilus assembly protein TadD
MRETGGEQRGLTLRQAIDLAVEHHSAGRLPEARRVCEEILQTDPNRPVVLHLLGLIAHQMGNHGDSVDLITKALALRPDYVEAHGNLGLALQGLGKTEEAIASHRRALAIKPDFAEVHNNLGVALQGLGKFGDAEAACGLAIAIKADYAEAYNNLGNALQS